MKHNIFSSVDEGICSRMIHWNKRLHNIFLIHRTCRELELRSRLELYSIVHQDVVDLKRGLSILISAKYGRTVHRIVHVSVCCLRYT
jgi:hypothetical protein